jgi:hypothetical protein
MATSKLHFTAHTDGAHAWISTASPCVQRCSRPGCRVSRHFKDGTWIEVQAPKSAKHAKPHIEQPALWG